KPAAFTGKGLVFVSVNYRFVTEVTMDVIARDVAKSVRWTHDHAARYGGDARRMFLMGPSAGAQLAALLFTDDRYFNAAGLSLTPTRAGGGGEGAPYEAPRRAAPANARYKSLGQPPPKLGYAEKFGTPAQQRDSSAVRHIARNKGIPPFLILHVADHTDVTAQ